MVGSQVQDRGQAAGGYRWVILAVAVLTQGGATIASQVVAPLAPLFQTDLGLTRAEVGLFSTAVFAGAWAVMLVAGSLTDRFGVRRMISLGQIAAGASMMFMAATTSFVQALGVMLLVGLTRGMVPPGVTKAVAEWFPARTRATAMGIKQTGTPLSGILAAAILPALGLAFGWRVALAALGIFVIGSGLIAAFLYRAPISASSEGGRKPGMRAGLRSVVKNPRLWVLAAIAVLLVINQIALTTYLALYFNESVLVSLVPDERSRIVAAGGYVAICQAGGAVGRILWGVVSDRLFHGRRLAVLALIGLLSAAMALVIGSLDPAWPVWLLGIVVFIAGTGAVGWNGVYHALVAETVPSEQVATSAGFSLTIIEFGTMLSAPLFGFIVDVSGSYQPAWFSFSLLAAAGGLLAMLAARSGHFAKG